MTELIARLRAASKVALNHDLLTAAADALEAARAEADFDSNDIVLDLPRNVVARYIAVPAERLAALEAERDAEASLADQMRDALTFVVNATGIQPHIATAALTAHRERRTTPTRPADDKTRWYGAPTKDGER